MTSGGEPGDASEVLSFEATARGTASTDAGDVDREGEKGGEADGYAD